MDAGFRGTFAIAWAESEIGGMRDAPPDWLTVGATWSWHGRAVRLDGVGDRLVLEHPHEDMRPRAARKALRLAGAGRGAPVPPDEGEPEPDGPLRDGFWVTDGRRHYAVALLAGSRRPILAFLGAVPPMGVECWVTRVTGLQANCVGPEAPAEICFAAGTRLRTPQGDRPVEALQPGDRVVTRDDGAQPVLWVGRSRLSGARLLVTPGLRPVRIRAGALDGGLPDGDLLVSPRHRVLLRGPRARALFNTDEVLVAAGDLVNDRTITLQRGLAALTYVHLLLPRHQVVWANGLPSESFNPAEAPLDRLAPEERDALLRALPDPAAYGPPARRLLTRAEAALLQHA